MGHDRQGPEDEPAVVLAGLVFGVLTVALVLVLLGRVLYALGVLL